MNRFIRSASFVLFASLLAFALPGCGTKFQDKVIGVWQWKVAGVTLLVTIKQDGTGSLKGPAGDKPMTWRIQRSNNFIMTIAGKESGFVIESADENTIQGSDPQAPGQSIVWTRKK